MSQRVKLFIKLFDLCCSQRLNWLALVTTLLNVVLKLLHGRLLADFLVPYLAECVELRVQDVHLLLDLPAH